jgi:hypothetical protein
VATRAPHLERLAAAGATTRGLFARLLTAWGRPAGGSVLLWDCGCACGAAKETCATRLESAGRWPCCRCCSSWCMKVGRCCTVARCDVALPNRPQRTHVRQAARDLVPPTLSCKFPHPPQVRRNRCTAGQPARDDRCVEAASSSSWHVPCVVYGCTQAAATSAASRIMHSCCDVLPVSKLAACPCPADPPRAPHLSTAAPSSVQSSPRCRHGRHGSAAGSTSAPPSC